MTEQKYDIHPLRKEISGLQDSLKSPLKNILSIGHVPSFSRYIQRFRTRIGLPGIPPTVYSDVNIANQILDLAKMVNVESKIGFDINKKNFKY
ncbi:MAG: hypothetical protein N3E39_00380 [Candidatus Methanomethylicia archaeon]|nr:hypothetical protein [Candidatus Methanomethylicia archaeon]